MKKALAAGLMVVAILVVCSPTALAQCEIQFPPIVGSLNLPSDGARDVTISGSYAYVASLQPDIQIVDISNPSSPVMVGSLSISGGGLAIAVSGSYAYLASFSSGGDWNGGLKVVDISNPSSPNLVGSLNYYIENPEEPDPAYWRYSPISATDIAVSGSIAYVTAQSSGLHIIDISVPSNPHLVTSVPFPLEGFPYAIALSGSHAYIARGSGLHVIDISDPSLPFIAGSVDTESPVVNIAIAGSYAYLVGTSFLHAIDISTPTAPHIVASVDAHFIEARGIAISGFYAYVADDLGVRIMDVSEPAAPHLVGSIDPLTPERKVKVAVSGSLACVVGDSGSGFSLIDVSSPSSPYFIGSVDTLGAASIAVSGHYAYVGNSFPGLQVVDVSDRSAPKIVGSVQTPHGSVRDVVISGDYAYLAAGSLEVMNVAIPWYPFIVGSTGGVLLGSTQAVAVSGSYAYVVCTDDGLKVIDISNPSSPQVVGSLPTDNYMEDIAISGSYAYIALPDPGLQIINISNPTSPYVVDSVDILNAYSVTISGSYAYVATWNQGLYVVDISAAPTCHIIGELDIGANGLDFIEVSGSYVYIDGFGGGIGIIDISNPSSPNLVGMVDIPNNPSDLAVVGSYAYAAAYGLEIVQLCEGLGEISLFSPANESIMYSPPTFTWTADSGTNNAYVVDMALSLTGPISGPVYSTPILYEPTWTMPTNAWNRIPSGSFVYWRVRGADLDFSPLTVIYSDEMWWFYKP